MMKWALTFVVNRIVLMAAFLMALNAFTQSSSCQYGSSQGFMRTLAGLPEALKTIGRSIH